MGTLVTGWIDYGTHLRVYADVPLRKNGLPNLAAARAAVSLLDTINPNTYDPFEPVPEGVAQAALRDGIARIGMEHAEMTADSPPVPVFDDDEFPGPRCANGACYGD